MQTEQQLRDLGITPEQKANLIKLRDHLRAVDESHFDMSRFGIGVASCEFATEIDHESCGTAACAVGHGPAAGVTPLGGERWVSYSRRVFTTGDGIWFFLFAADWKSIDDSAAGAAKRIDIVLKDGLSSVMQDGEAETDFFTRIKSEGLPYAK